MSDETKGTVTVESLTAELETLKKARSGQDRLIRQLVETAGAENVEDLMAKVSQPKPAKAGPTGRMPLVKDFTDDDGVIDWDAYHAATADWTRGEAQTAAQTVLTGRDVAAEAEALDEAVQALPDHLRPEGMSADVLRVQIQAIARRSSGGGPASPATVREAAKVLADWQAKAYATRLQKESQESGQAGREEAPMLPPAAGSNPSAPVPPAVPKDAGTKEGLRQALKERLKAMP